MAVGDDAGGLRHALERIARVGAVHGQVAGPAQVPAQEGNFVQAFLGEEAELILEDGEQRGDIEIAAVVGDEDVVGLRIELFQSFGAYTRTKLTASSILPQTRARWWGRLPLRSKKETTMESRSITMVQSTMRGTEKSVDRSRLIESLRLYQEGAGLGHQEQGTGDEDGVGQSLRQQRQRGLDVGGDCARLGWSAMSRMVSGARARAWSRRGDDHLRRRSGNRMPPISATALSRMAP